MGRTDEDLLNIRTGCHPDHEKGNAFVAKRHRDVCVYHNGRERCFSIGPTYNNGGTTDYIQENGNYSYNTSVCSIFSIP